MSRNENFLTVLEGKLTAIDCSDYEVLGEDSIWRKHEYAGEKQADYGISYASKVLSELVSQ